MADMQITVDALKLGYERTVLMLCVCVRRSWFHTGY